MGENLFVGSHVSSSEDYREKHDKTFKRDSDFICYKCWHKWDVVEIDLTSCSCPHCGHMAERRRRVDE